MPEPSHGRAPRPRRRIAIAAPPPAVRLPEGSLWFAGLLLALLVLALLLPEPVEAQITSGLRPPERRAPAQEVARAESTIAAVRDSAAREERLDLRAWVDSAATSLESGGAPVTPMPDVPGDTLVPRPGTPATPATPGARRPDTLQARPAPPRGTPPGGAPPGQPTTRFREGAPAPDTATPLPLLAAVGGAMVGAGIWLRRRR